MSVSVLRILGLQPHTLGLAVAMALAMVVADDYVGGAGHSYGRDHGYACGH